MKISNVNVIRPRFFNEALYRTGIEEFSTVFENITASRIQNYFEANGRESDKSISRFVNGLIIEELLALDWEKNWSFCPDVRSNHATFEASKKFQGGRKQ